MRRVLAAPGTPALLTRAAAALLWALVLVGAGSGIAGLLRPTAAAVAAVPPPEAPPLVMSFAQRFVVAWLEVGVGEEERLAAFLGQVPDATVAGPGGRYVARTTAVSALSAGAGRWQVEVAADVLEADEGGYAPPTTLVAMVGVVQGPTGLTATGLPGLVPGPAPAAAPAVATGFRPPDLDDPPVAAVAGFFGAALAGTGEVDRYAAPGSGLRAHQPRPYRQVSLVGVRGPLDGADALALDVAVDATDDAGARLRLEYGVRVVRRDDRWEVAAIGPVALVDAASPVTDDLQQPNTPALPPAAT